MIYVIEQPEIIDIMVRFVKKIFLFFLLVCFSFAVFSCNTHAKAELRLIPPKSVTEVRFDDISGFLDKDPARAIHLIEVYRIIYGPDTVYPEAEIPAIKEQLERFENEAVENLKSAQKNAVEEKRWADAASLARSLSVLGIPVESTGEEPELTLEYAREQIEKGNKLAAFLAAAQSHELKPLAFEDALFFLEKAVEAKQRRTAAFFLNIIELGNNKAPPELKNYADGRDTASNMIKGVATVLVDRGYRVQRGMGMPEWVLGSAFFVDSSGLLITNYHVISSEVDPKYQGYSRMYIRMGDSTSARIPAKVIGWDKALDLALIKAEIKPEYVFSVADRTIPDVGDTVYAIGSPAGLEKTVTQGIVSALSRRFLQIGDVIQIDAAVNHGNSGGPVVDTAGRLVGIVFAGADQFQGLNFAIPAERLAAALPAMIAGGKAERPWLGLSLSETVHGAEIIYVAPSTPSSDQRIPEGSLIKALNGKEIKTAQGALIPAMQDILFPLKTGELVSVDLVDSEGNGFRRLMRLAARPELPMADAAKIDSRERIAAPLFGIILAAAAGSSFSPSYQVKKVVRGSIADHAGLSENDPVSIRGFKLLEREGYALLDISVKKRRMGYMESAMQLPALLDTPDTL
ncbi:MAG: trypsin-like peptidase domain-containing protein [Treponema sp.]|nr:trypsin-like peptidase domain-containing protein [Treponema sp.]